MASNHGDQSEKKKLLSDDEERTGDLEVSDTSVILHVVVSRISCS